jgi:anti-anti-sigma factor
MNAAEVSHFEVRTIEEPGAYIVQVSGEIDLATAQEFEAAVVSGIETAGALVIDLSDCGFMDSTGISVLIRARTSPAGREGPLALVCDPAGAVARLLRLAAEGLFDVFPTLAAALADKVAG